MWFLMPCLLFLIDFTQSCEAFVSTVPLQIRLGSSHLHASKVTIRIVGRRTSGEPWIEQGYEMYATRLRPAQIEVTTEWHKSDEALIKGVQGDVVKGAPVVLLDPNGKHCTSEKLAEDFYQWLEAGGSRMVFVIGASEGLPPELRSSNDYPLISFSQLTFTHQMARLLLVEQLYRASEIRKGSGYHK